MGQVAPDWQCSSRYTGSRFLSTAAAACFALQHQRHTSRMCTLGWGFDIRLDYDFKLRLLSLGFRVLACVSVAGLHAADDAPTVSRSLAEGL